MSDRYEAGFIFALDEFRFGVSIDGDPPMEDDKDYQQGFSDGRSEARAKIEALPLFEKLKSIRESGSPSGLDVFNECQFIDYVHGQSVALSRLTDDFSPDKAQSLMRAYRYPQLCMGFNQGMVDIVNAKLKEFEELNSPNESPDAPKF